MKNECEKNFDERGVPLSGKGVSDKWVIQLLAAWFSILGLCALYMEVIKPWLERLSK